MYLKARLFLVFKSLLKKCITIKVWPILSLQRAYGNFHWSSYIVGVQTFIKKLDLWHYHLTHILLSFQGSYYKFPPKAHMFLMFKNSFKKLYQGLYGLTHTVPSRILCKYWPITRIFFGVQIVLKNCIRDSVVWLLSSFL